MVQRELGGSEIGVRESSKPLKTQETWGFKNSRETKTWRGQGEGQKEN